MYNMLAGQKLEDGALLFLLREYLQASTEGPVARERHDVLRCLAKRMAGSFGEGISAHDLELMFERILSSAETKNK
jgi:hypothetical protein